MKIKCFLLLPVLAVALLYCLPTFSQSKTRFGNRFNFEYRQSIWENSIIHIPDTAIYQALKLPPNGFEQRIPKSLINLGVKLNPEGESRTPSSILSGSKTYSRYFIDDGSEGLIIAMGINHHNVDQFRYRVVENDSSEIVPWSKIPMLEQKYGAKQPYGFIGRFKAPEKQLLVEVKNINDYSIRDGIIFDWRTKLKPTLKHIAIFARAKGRIQYFNLKDDEFKLGFASRFDPKTNIPLDFKFREKSVEDIQIYLENHYGMPYSVSIRSKVSGDLNAPSLNEIRPTLEEATYQIARTHFYYPGKYEILINRCTEFGPLPDSEALRIPFEVLPEPFLPEKVRTEQVILYAFMALIFAGLIFSFYNNRNKIRLKAAAQEKQQAGLKLKSIRSQLNPHFMFNALSSIQNLINKNDVAGANHYLSIFSGLTRRVLDTNNDELISLAEEITILDEYLKMEQLRFGFIYNIHTAEELNLPNIDVPAMLLQPFVENAVKHGISGQHEKGILSITIEKEQANLIIVISDNGKGFDKRKQASGYGLKLSEERIALLNQLYKEQPLSLTIVTGETGTIVTLKLKNWLA